MNPPAAELPDDPTNVQVDPDATRSMSADDQASRLANILDQYLADLQAGGRPDRQTLLAEHPELASQLESCLSGIEFIHRASAPLPLSGTPTQLGDFRIVREVGRGGMGVVYEAEQVSLKRRVALKVLRYGAAADTEAMQRFQREAETVAGLHHTNIVPIFAIGSEQGVNYYAMQFIEGRSLAEGRGLRDEGQENRTPSSPSPLSPHSAAQVAGWGLQAAEALGHAHQRGVVHRDIKPSNLILDPDGQLWLTDFGLAKRLDDVTLSMAGAILGTPRYMSPEQASSLKHPVDHRTDIYSLGATLYELVTGRPVFDAETAHGVITQILTAAPPAPRLVRPDVPRDFETIILKCLAKEPGQRYATARALADDLRAFVEGRAIKARRATLAEQATRWFKQQKRSVGIAATAVAATIAVVVGSLIAWQMHGQSRLGYLTLNTPREGEQRAEVAEVLSLDDVPVLAPFTLPTKEPVALPEGAYRLRLTAPSKVSQTYLFDVAAGTSVTHEVGLVNETVGYAIPLRSPVGVEVVADAASVRADAGSVGHVEPRLFIGPQDSSQPTLRCYSVRSQPQQRVVQEGASSTVSQGTEPQPFWVADWRLEAPGIVSFLKLPEDKEAWKVLPAQTDVFAWQQMLAWFDPWWFWNGTPPRVLQPARDLNGDEIADVIWTAPRMAQPLTNPFGPGPLTPKAAVLVAASGKDGQPLWWFRPQDANGGAAALMTSPIWASSDTIVCVLRSMNSPATWLEAIDARTGESLWRFDVPHAGGSKHQSVHFWATLEVASPRGETERSLVVATVSQFVVAVDIETGKPLWEPHDLGRLLRLPRLFDLDDDGLVEVLSVGVVEGDAPQLTATSLANRKPLWSAPLSWFPKESSGAWLEVVDLEDDGHGEVILPSESYDPQQHILRNGVQVLDGQTGQPRWSRQFPRFHYRPETLRPGTERFTVGPDLDGDGNRELFMTSIRSEIGPVRNGHAPVYHHEQYFLYVDCFSGNDGRSVWWQRIPLGMSEYAAWTGTVGELLWWGSANSISRNALASGSELGQASASGKPDASAFRLIIPVHRHPDTQNYGGTHSLFVLSAMTGRVEHQADDVAFPQFVDWNNDGLDDLAVIVPDDPVVFENRHQYPNRMTGKFVVLRGSPPEAFRRLDRWVEEQDFDGDGIAELSHRYHGNGDYAIQIASGRDGRIMSKWKTEWPETPRSFTVGSVQSFPPPLGDFDGDGRADLLVSREGYNWDFERMPLIKTGMAPLLMQAISSKTGKRIWGGVPLPLPDWLRPTDVDENSDQWKQLRSGRLQPISTQAVDVDGDGQPEVLQTLTLTGYRRSEQDSSLYNEHQQPFVALIDGRAGTLRWCEPIFDAVRGSHSPGLDYLRIDASTDLNGDGTRDLVLTVPRQDSQGAWSMSLQVHNGRDGKVLWGPKPLEGTSFNNNDFNPPIVSDLDGDGHPEIVLMPSKQPHVTVVRGDTGESLWTWQSSQPQYFQSPGIAVVASRLGTPARPDAESTTEDKDKMGKSAHPTKRCVAVAFNETGSQWNLVLLDHTGQELERVPCQSSQLWSQDLDGDGGEELLWSSDKIKATRGLHEVLWTWSPPPLSYGWVSHIERTPNGRVIVAMSSNDSVTLLDGKTGKSLGRTWKSCNTSTNENGRTLDLNRPKLNSAGESPRLLTRVGDGSAMLPHVVSRAVLPTDDDGKYPSRMGTLARPAENENQPTRTGKSAHPTDDPRLIRQLPWAPSAGEWSSSFWIMLLMQIARAMLLSLVIVLIPFWLIRAGVLRRELGWWRGALIVTGLVIIALSIAAMRSFTSSPGMRGIPWGAQLAMAFGALPILAWPTAIMRSVFRSEWRRLQWLLGGSLIAAGVLAVVRLWQDSASISAEQHYSWHGWWFILLLGAYAVGGLLVVWRVIGPGVCWLWNFGRRTFARHG